MIRRILALLGAAGMSTGFAEAIHLWKRFTSQICTDHTGLDPEGAADCFARQEPNIMILSIFFGCAALVLLVAILLPRAGDRCEVALRVRLLVRTSGSGSFVGGADAVEGPSSTRCGHWPSRRRITEGPQWCGADLMVPPIQQSVGCVQFPRSLYIEARVARRIENVRSTAAKR